MSIKTDIEAYTGDIDSPDYTTEALQFVNDGIRYIYSLVLTNPEMTTRLASEETLNTTTTILPTTTMENVMSLDYITRSDGTIQRECVEGEASMEGLYNDADSLHRATITNPVYFIKNNTLVVVPTPSDAQPAKISVVTPDLVADVSALSSNYSTASSKLLPELRNGVTLYAASNILLKKMNAIGKPTDTNLATMVAGDVDTAGDRIDITKWFDIVGDYIQDEDVELASAYLSKINSYLQNYQMELTGDQSQYQWYESQYVKVSQSLVAFLEPYVGA
jgi:hypothetical protein